MFSNRETEAYKVASASGLTHAGVLQLVYGQLAQDLFTAGAAAEKTDVAARCVASKHALLLLGHLEDWVQLLEDPALIGSLRDFYAMLRVQVVRLQANPHGSSFQTLAEMVLETRSAWQQMEVNMLPTPNIRTGDDGRLSWGVNFLA